MPYLTRGRLGKTRFWKNVKYQLSPFSRHVNWGTSQRRVGFSKKKSEKVIFLTFLQLFCNFLQLLSFFSQQFPKRFLQKNRKFPRKTQKVHKISPNSKISEISEISRLFFSGFDRFSRVLQTFKKRKSPKNPQKSRFFEKNAFFSLFFLFFWPKIPGYVLKQQNWGLFCKKNAGFFSVFFRFFPEISRNFSRSISALHAMLHPVKCILHHFFSRDFFRKFGKISEDFFPDFSPIFPRKSPEKTLEKMSLPAQNNGFGVFFTEKKSEKKKCEKTKKWNFGKFRENFGKFRKFGENFRDFGNSGDFEKTFVIFL